jgi:hypothetical protein
MENHRFPVGGKVHVRLKSVAPPLFNGGQEGAPGIFRVFSAETPVGKV